LEVFFFSLLDQRFSNFTGTHFRTVQAAEISVWLTQVNMDSGYVFVFSGSDV
jgi:hypothetical protein